MNSVRKGKQSVSIGFVIYFLFRFTKWERRGTNTREFPFQIQIPQGTCDTDGYILSRLPGVPDYHFLFPREQVEFVRGSGHQYTELRSVIIERENNEEVIHQLREEIEHKDNTIHELQEINRATELDKRNAELEKQEALTSSTFCKTELDANWQLNLPNNQDVKKALKDGRKSLVPRLVPEMENKLYTLLCDFCKIESLQFVLTSGEMKTYVAGCVKLSLIMNANDPPVAIDCPGWVPCISQKESIYQSKHEEDPGLLKHKGNTQVPSNVDGNGSNQNITPDLKERRAFNKELFKEYTMRGKYVEFFVWPVMYLHEDGPVLTKGIAQGAEVKMVSDNDHRWEWWKTSDSL
ncbi:hypothetical protein MAR_022514 [Mya arenaria]|uniref:Mitochondria-eating protein C-terminal domain-containing protein n=1 Tax=Mya arenaria TaxID=6604 RepID=A0ABY7DMG2_MYAAR|nr:hypothetical protein MAR_022514 [Mya arenaria]